MVSLLTTHSVDDRWLAKDVNRRVAARMKRQERLTGSNPLQLTAVVSQGALERCARQPSVGRAQLRRLIACAQWPNIELRVLPFEVGLHVAMAASFMLLSFPEGLLNDVAYQEYAVGGESLARITELASAL